MLLVRLRRWARQHGWIVPGAYVLLSIALAYTLAMIDTAHPIRGVRPIERSAAEQLFGAIATGMIAFTGIVFSVSLLVTQSWNASFSMRLIQWLRQAPLWGHAVGVFSATFVYALVALTVLGRTADTSLVLTEAGAISLLLASVLFFLLLLYGTLRQMNLSYVIDLIGRAGRVAIDDLYGDPGDAEAPAGADLAALAETGALVHRGPPRVVAAIHFTRLVDLATKAEARIEVEVGVGDTVPDGAVIARIVGGPIPPERLRSAFLLGTERTMEQDPKLALRLLADVAIKALSPAVNDPTTAVQALDQIEDLLLRIGQRRLDLGRLVGARGYTRVTYPAPTWDDVLALGTDEIRLYGRTSLQVVRRLRLLLLRLEEAVTEDRRPAVRDRLQRLDEAVEAEFDGADLGDARRPDPQGLGLSRAA